MSFKYSNLRVRFALILIFVIVALLAIRIAILYVVGTETPETNLIEEILLYLQLVIAVHLVLSFRERVKWGQENYRYFMTVYRLMKEHDKSEKTSEQIITELKELVS